MRTRVEHISDEETLNSYIESEKDNFDAYERTTFLLDFRNVKGNTNAIEMKSVKLQKKVPNIQICKVDQLNNVWIEIRNEQDYSFFFQEFIENGKMKKEYEASKFKRREL